MATVRVYGASDDLIEVDGAIQEEFGAFSHEEDDHYLAFSDGTVLCLNYGKRGIWEVRKVASGTAEFSVFTAFDSGDDNTDRATLTGDNLRWVVFGKQFVAARKESNV